jgi:hypothetical protein
MLITSCAGHMVALIAYRFSCCNTFYRNLVHFYFSFSFSFVKDQFRAHHCVWHYTSFRGDIWNIDTWRRLSVANVEYTLSTLRLAVHYSDNLMHLSASVRNL